MGRPVIGDRAGVRVGVETSFDISHPVVWYNTGRRYSYGGGVGVNKEPKGWSI